ncbi:hypothetical protein Mterra_02645 [Calidithermus terrae]|uniref:HicA toxin of bacterial toxin-antitoxin n=1 Tax=Calidithermus terrae TaxID=1408545 RepID=A0A399EJF9_9DEIN|nr:hypothetical protein Mterra_02645 [Calidithermus terrae]
MPPRQTTAIPSHSGELPKGTFRKILKYAGIREEEYGNL